MRYEAAPKVLRDILTKPKVSGLKNWSQQLAKFSHTSLAGLCIGIRQAAKGDSLTDSPESHVTLRMAHTGSVCDQRFFPDKQCS